MRILAIDPGNVESAYVVLDKDLRPIEFAKENNVLAKDTIEELIYKYGIKNVAIEMVASYGMAVGREVFETCVWIGRFTESCKRYLNIEDVTYIYRKDEKINLCGSMKANDSNITQVLVDRFAYGQPNRGKGTKASKGWFYGFKKDIWQAYAVGVTYYDMYIKAGDKNA